MLRIGGDKDGLLDGDKWELLLTEGTAEIEGVGILGILVIDGGEG